MQEDFLPKLKSLRGRMKVYKEMKTDPTVGAILFAIEMHLRKVSWHVEPLDDTSEEAHRDAEFVEECRTDMSHTFQDFLSEVLSMLPFGFSVHEIVYKQGEDGMIRWKKLPIRSQDTVYKWHFDSQGGLDGFEQWAPLKGRRVFIPIEKALLFRPSIYKGNPEGQSVLRTAYRPWYFRTKLETIEAIGLERDLTGYPVLNVPFDLFVGDELSDEMRSYAESMITRIRKDEQMGAVLPPGWELDLLSAQGTSKPDTGAVIQRYDVRIAQSLLSDIIMLGHQRAGSYALSEQKYQLFITALSSWLDSIAEVFNRYAIPRLLALNGKNTKLRLVHDPVAGIDPTTLANVLFRLVRVKGIEPDGKLERYLRNFLGLPQKESETSRGAEESDSREGEFREDNETRPADASGEYTQETISHGGVNR